MKTMPDRFTAADYDLLPEGFPAELIGGQLLREAAPNYGHQRIEARMLASLVALVGPDRALPFPVDVRIDAFNVFQPDVVVLRQQPAGDEVRDLGIPLIAIEVLARDTAQRDRGIKCRRMLKAGVAEVWIIDREAGSIELFTLDAHSQKAQGGASSRFARGDTSLSSAAVPGFVLTPAQLFSPPAPFPLQPGGGPPSE